MSLIKPVLYTLSLIGMVFFLGGCERDVYTTWSCNSASETKIPMILRKAQMEFQGVKIDYCGSLGNQSFFEQKCPAQTGQSSAIFTPSSGALIVNGQAYQCTAL